MVQHLQVLSLCALAALVSSSSALHLEYEVKAEFPGRSAPEFPSHLKKEQKEALAKNMKNGLRSSIKTRAYAGEGYSVLPSIIPDWTKMKLSTRENGWDERIYFSTEAGFSTLGERAALIRYIPHGQRLLLAGSSPPADVYAKLKQKASGRSDHVAAINETGSREVTWMGDHLKEEIVFKGGRKKYAEYRMVQGTSLEIRRFHPKGHLVGTETWKPIRELDEASKPLPTWETWQIGAWVMDERDTSQPLHKRWQGYGKEPLSGDAAPVRATSFKVGWAAPGIAMLVGGIGLLVYQTVRRKPTKGGKKS